MMGRLLHRCLCVLPPFYHLRRLTNNRGGRWHQPKSVCLPASLWMSMTHAHHRSSSLHSRPPAPVVCPPHQLPPSLPPYVLPTRPLAAPFLGVGLLSPILSRPVHACTCLRPSPAPPSTCPAAAAAAVCQHSQSLCGGQRHQSVRAPISQPASHSPPRLLLLPLLL